MAELLATSYHAGIFDMRPPLTLQAIFSHAWQLQDGDGWILTVGSLPYNGPLTVRLVSPLDNLSVHPGDRASLERDVLTIGRVRISLRSARSWEPRILHLPIVPHALQRGFAALSACNRTLYGCASPSSPLSPSTTQTIPTQDGTGGIGDGLVHGGTSSQAEQPATGQPAYTPGISDNILVHVVPSRGDHGFKPLASVVGATSRDISSDALVALKSALSRGDARGALQSAIQLLGLGPGLTPTGDDILVGLLAGLYILGERLGRGLLPPGLADGLVRTAVGRTTALSQTLIACAARGVVVEPLSDLLCTVGSGQEVVGLNRLMGIGHTSGRDMLVGARLAASFLEEEGVGGPALVDTA